MEALVEHPAHCPHCNAPISFLIDTTIPQQDYIEDCEVCCAPVRILVSIDDAISLELHRDT